MYRSDRNRPENLRFPHGGVCVFFKEHLHVTPFSYSNGDVEVLICNVPKINLVLVTVYRPPNSSVQSFQQVLVFIRENLDSVSNKTVLLMGDFNLNSSVVTWIKHQDMPGFYPYSQSQSPVFNRLEELIVEYGLIQLVGQSTSKKNILDLVFCNELDAVSDITVAPIEISDHYLLEIETKLPLQPKPFSPSRTQKVGVSKFVFEEHHWPKICSEILERDLLEIVAQEDSLEKAYEVFLSELEAICVSLGVPIFNRVKKGPHVIPRFRQKLFKKRARISRSLSSCSNVNRARSLVERLSEVDESIKASIEQETQWNESKVISHIKNNPKAFYSYANSKRKSPHSLGPLKFQGKELSQDLEMANILTDQFSSVYTHPVQFPHNKVCLNRPVLDEIEINDEDVLEAIMQLNPTSSPGPDGMTCQFLIQCRLSLAPILTLLFSRSYQESRLPSVLKLAIITPLFKGGDSSDPANQRVSDF